MLKDSFQLLRAEELPELNSRGLLYRHRTGAEVLSLINEDENKVFGITFRTPPKDSTGVAHILEHAVLCGSRKYPVKEPFVELIKGSLNTFLNAFTYPDKTCYPVASTNLQDFYNLMDVYLDAVFYPRITPQVLQQEGWHYEVDESGALSYKGVVFNEMKGAYSDPERVMSEYSQHALFPDTTYGVESGGHPRHIPDLSYAQFKGFHEEFYHPANARIYFYGDDDPDRRLELIEEYLKDFEPRAVDSQIPAQSRFAAPRTQVHHYAVDGQEEGKARSMVTINWLLEGVDADERRTLQILEYALVGTPASPLRKALIDSGLGEDLIGGGLETDLLQVCFWTGLKGVAQEKVGAVEKLVLETLESIERDGIDPQMRAAALNTLEFRLRENNTGSFPRGLVLMLRALSDWLYERDPFVPLRFEQSLRLLKERLEADGRCLEKLIRRHLLDNGHRTTVIMHPDAELGARQEEEEEEQLARARAAMSAAEVEAVGEEAEQLRQAQERPDPPEALATLPRLSLEDLDPRIKDLPIDPVERQGACVLYHDLFTNGIVYLDIGFDLHALPQDLLPYVPLFGRALLEMGTEREDFVRLQQRIGARTGGLWTQPLVSARREGGPSTAWLFVRGKAMVGRADELLDIVRDVLLGVRLDDRERFLQMLLEEKAGEESGLVPGGHRVVATRLRARFDEASWAAEQMRGVSYLFFLRRLVEEVHRDWPAVLARLEEVRSRLVNRRTLIGNATLSGADRPFFDERLGAFLQTLPEAEWQPSAWQPDFGGGDEGLTIPAQVNYVGKAANLYDLGYELDGSAGVITRFLSTTWLWDRVRVQGGAYGAFCSFDHYTGVLAFASYRDPNLLKTLEIYDGSAAFLRDVALSREELTKAIIGAVGDMDAYQLPDAKGFTSMVRHLTGTTDAFRQRLRDEVLGTSEEQFREFARVLEGVGERGRVVVMGAAEQVEAADAQRGGWLKKLKVL